MISLLNFEPTLAWILNYVYAKLVLKLNTVFLYFSKKNGQVGAKLSSIKTVSFDQSIFQNRAAKYLAQATIHCRSYTDKHVSGQEVYK